MVHESEGFVGPECWQGMEVLQKFLTFLPFPGGEGLSGSGVTPAVATVEGVVW